MLPIDNNYSAQMKEDITQYVFYKAKQLAQTLIILLMAMAIAITFYKYDLTPFAVSLAVIGFAALLCVNFLLLLRRIRKGQFAMNENELKELIAWKNHDESH